MERIINTRLLWIIESSNLLSDNQCGFRFGLSTDDQQNSIQKASIKKHHLLAVFFDSTIAFNTTWKHKIFHTLRNWNLKGRLAMFIQNYLSTRKFYVRINEFKSPLHDLINGIPHGSVYLAPLYLTLPSTTSSMQFHHPQNEPYLQMILRCLFPARISPYEKKFFRTPPIDYRIGLSKMVALLSSQNWTMDLPLIAPPAITFCSLSTPFNTQLFVS